MKIIFSVLVLLIMTTSAKSQVEVDIFGGPQITSAYYTVFNQKQKTDSKIGFNVGMGLKVPFEEKLFFAPAAFYSMKGYKVTFSQFVYPPDADATNDNVTLHTFELAPLLQYDFNTASNHFFIKAGPSLDFQLLGHEKFDRMLGSPVDRSMKFSYNDYGHFSANLLGQLGYETGSGLLVFAQYTHGLASIVNTDGGPHIKHRVFGITVGKYLNRKK